VSASSIKSSVDPFFGLPSKLGNVIAIYSAALLYRGFAFADDAEKYKQMKRNQNKKHEE
jgi:hypothetical protein